MVLDAVALVPPKPRGGIVARLRRLRFLGVVGSDEEEEEEDDDDPEDVVDALDEQSNEFSASAPAPPSPSSWSVSTWVAPRFVWSRGVASSGTTSEAAAVVVAEVARFTSTKRAPSESSDIDLRRARRRFTSNVVVGGATVGPAAASMSSAGDASNCSRCMSACNEVSARAWWSGSAAASSLLDGSC